MFDLLEPFLRKGGYKFTRCTPFPPPLALLPFPFSPLPKLTPSPHAVDGKLNQKKKEAALDQIRNDPSTTIILVSIKCGAVGLNLTVCSRVLLLDLWWNPCVFTSSFLPFSSTDSALSLPSPSHRSAIEQQYVAPFVPSLSSLY